MTFLTRWKVSIFVFLLCFIGIVEIVIGSSDWEGNKSNCKLTIYKQGRDLIAKVKFENFNEFPIGLYLKSYRGKGDKLDTCFEVYTNGHFLSHRGRLDGGEPWGSHLVFVKPGKTFVFETNLSRFYAIAKGNYKICYKTFLYYLGDRSLHGVDSNFIQIQTD